MAKLFGMTTIAYPNSRKKDSNIITVKERKHCISSFLKIDFKGIFANKSKVILVYAGRKRCVALLDPAKRGVEKNAGFVALYAT